MAAVVAAGLWATTVWNRTAALVAIEKMGGSFRYEWQFDANGKFDADARRPLPSIWERLFDPMLGHNWNHAAKEIEFHKGCTDDEVRLLPAIPTVEVVNLAYCFEVTDVGVGYVAELPRLRRLKLYRNDPEGGTKFTPRNFDPLKQGRITDAALLHLANCKTLEELYLWDNDFSDRGVQYLERSNSLREMGIRSPKVTLAAIERLRAAIPQCHVDAEIWK